MEAMQRTHHRRALAAAAIQSPSGWYSLSQTAKGGIGGRNQKSTDFLRNIEHFQLQQVPLLAKKVCERANHADRWLSSICHSTFSECLWSDWIF